jgi:hypothetical protein
VIDHHSIPEPNSGCWIWLGGVSPLGYGKMSMSLYRKEQQAHRISYLIHKGPIPDGMKILHSCDNSLCVNPDHLSVGTQADNVLDAQKKRRLRAVRALTNEQVGQIRMAKASGERTMDLAKQYGVHTSTIYLACTREYVDVLNPIVRESANG